MKRYVLILSLLAAPAFAQDEGEAERGLSLMERGAQLFLEGLLSEVEPAITELEGLLNDAGPQLEALLREMGPAFAELMGRLDDISNYEAPELLPNGDIIIRRKPEAPVFDPSDGVEL
ncbi:MAG: hypothetical protein ACU0DW_01710 [Shimia sp.]